MAQVTPCPERFLAYNSQGQEATTFCVGEKIKFKSCLANSQPDKEYYDFDKADGLQISTDTTKFFIYTKPGTYTVTQVINTAGGDNQGERTFTVLATPLPVFQVIACALNQVSVSITDNIYDSFTIDFGDNTVQQAKQGATLSHQYKQSGTFNIKVTGRYTQTNCSASQTTPVQLLPPPATPVLDKLETQSNNAAGTIVFTWQNAQPEYYYVIEKVNGNAFVPLDTIKNPATTSVFYNLTADTRSASGYRVRVTDRCGSALSTVSNIIYSLPLTVTTANNQINLAWSNYPDQSQILRYEVLRNKQLYVNVPVGNSSYQDTALTCGTEYCYQVIAVLRNNRQSVSNEQCQSATATQPPKPGSLYSTFTADNTVEIKFTSANPENIKEITYQKSSNNNAFTSLAVVAQNEYTDAAEIDLNNQFCYQAFYQNNCGQTSGVSNKTCPSILQATLSDNNEVNLTWSAYVGASTGSPQYFIEKLNTAGTLTQTIPVSGTTYTDNQLGATEQQLIYRIKVELNNAAQLSYSNSVVLNQSARILIPTAFTPNHDNLNDLFEVKGQFVNIYRMLIYNRWGEIIYDNKSSAIGWDGRMNGKEAPVGTYPYKITVKDINQKEYIKTGTVTLLR